MSHRGAGFSVAYGPKASQKVRKAVAKAEATEAASDSSRRKAHNEQDSAPPVRQSIPEPVNPPTSKRSEKIDAARPKAPKIPSDQFHFDPKDVKVSNEE